jgi:hypothetical protein
MRTIANVHRFRDKVAVSVGNGETTYLTWREASKLAEMLTECTISVLAEDFVDSTFGNRNIEREEE